MLLSVVKLGFGAKIAEFSSNIVLKQATVPSIHVSLTLKQLNKAQRKKRKLPLPNKQSRNEQSRNKLSNNQGTNFQDGGRSWFSIGS